jgi:hypothetical protein
MSSGGKRGGLLSTFTSARAQTLCRTSLAGTRTVPSLRITGDSQAMALSLLLGGAQFGSITIVTFGVRLTAAAYLAGPSLRAKRLVAPVVYLL